VPYRAVPFPADRNESHKSRCQIVVVRPSAISSIPLRRLVTFSPRSISLSLSFPH
jgi:hypothetical protein